MDSSLPRFYLVFFFFFWSKFDLFRFDWNAVQIVEAFVRSMRTLSLCEFSVNVFYNM